MSVFKMTVLTLGVLRRLGQGLGLIHVTIDGNNQVFI